MSKTTDPGRLLVALAGTTIAGALPGCRGQRGGEEGEVAANEDLMRDHGVIRRALLVYITSGPSRKRTSFRWCAC